MEPVAVFIDGFNLYHGMVDAGLRPWLWVDLWRLAEKLTGSTRFVAEVNYYTAPVKQASGSQGRQQAFVNAHKTLRPSMRIVEGFMQSESRACLHCGSSWQHWAEKRTDVNIAVDMLVGGLLDRRFVTAILVTGDSDQVATVETLVKAGVRVVCAFPPERESEHLKSVATENLRVSHNQLKRCQLPDTIGSASGYPILRPTDWGER